MIQLYDNETEMEWGNFRVWVVLVVFLLEILLIHCRWSLPLLIPIWDSSTSRKKLRRVRFPLDYTTGSVIGVIVLLCTTVITWDQLVRGILGSEKGIQPLSVLVLIYCLAYICVSLDLTGLFSYLALLVVAKCGKSGNKLFVSFFFLSVVIAGLASNDVVVLTLSPLICYFAQALSIDPWPFLVAEFVAANTASMALYVGNPTNVVISMAYDLSFVKYSQFLSLPFLVVIVAELLLLWLLFRSKYPQTIPVINVQPREALLRPYAALSGFLSLLISLIALVICSFFNLPVWAAVLPLSLFTFLVDLGEDTLNLFRSRSAPDLTKEMDATLNPADQSNPKPASLSLPDKELAYSIHSFHSTPLPLPMLNISFAPATSRSSLTPRVISSAFLYLATKFPLTVGVLIRLPWGIIPFLLGMFVSVEAVYLMGWTRILATGFITVFHSSPIAWCLGIGIFSALLSGLLNNLPAAILLARSLETIDFHSSPPCGTGAVLGLIVACNLGALFTPSGSLAGLMWRDILTRKGLPPKRSVLLRSGLVIFPLTLLLALATLLLQSYFVGDIAYFTSSSLPSASN